MNTGDRTYGNAVGVIPDPEIVGILVAEGGDVLDKKGVDEGANDATTSNNSPITRPEINSGSSTPSSTNF